MQGQKNSDHADRDLSKLGTPAPRIASLVPSLTETVVALGLGDRLVARTGYCIHPAPALRGVPKVGGTKTVNLPKLRRLAPTHVLVNVDENRLETVEALRDFVPNVVVTHPCDPVDNLALVDQLATAFADQPGVGAAALRWRQALAEALAMTVPDGRPACEVLYLIWHSPWMTVARDTYIARTLARVNWQTCPNRHGGLSGAARYPVLDDADPTWRRVGQVLLSSEPFAFGPEHVDAVRRLAPQARVRRVDGEALSWYGVRAVAGLGHLRALATPG